MNILWVAGVRIILKKGGAVLHSQVLDQSGSINTGIFGTKLRITIDQLDGAIGLGVCGYKSEMLRPKLFYTKQQFCFNVAPQHVLQNNRFAFSTCNLPGLPSDSKTIWQ